MTASENRPADYLEQGAEILGKVLKPHGFKFRIEQAAIRGSGGESAEGSFRADDKRLVLHFRWSLGLVTYHVGKISVSHEEYMRCLGTNRDAEYPGFSDKPLKAFSHLASDLTRFCQNFVRDDDSEIVRFAGELEKEPGKFKGLP